MALRPINLERAWLQAWHVCSLIREHWPERAPPLLLSLRPRPPPANLALHHVEFAEPRYLPVLQITPEDLAPFSPRDWEAFFLAHLTPASPSPSSADKTVSASPFPIEVALAIALAGATVLFVALVKYRRMRRRGGGGGSGGRGGWGRRRLGGGPGLVSLLPGCGGARLTRHAFEDEGSLARAAEADGAAWLARLAAAGTRGRSNADLELLQRVVLLVRRALQLPQPEERYTIGIGVQHQASVAEWISAPSMEEADVYRAASGQKVGTIVWPQNMNISETDETAKMRKERVDKCSCSRPGSVNCVRVHITKARVWIKDQLGEVAFRNCGLDAMGEQVEKLWTEAEKKKLEEAAKLILQNKDQNFINIALEELTTKDLAKYYYNVFRPRRLATWTRAEHKKNGLDDDNNEHRPQ